ncbi:MAG TPA: hypothetical protein VMU67_17140 [Steroidobacteraceae bacterium]|nr:hypothetical protein [Steroidobacteraceae bacterium]
MSTPDFFRRWRLVTVLFAFALAVAGTAGAAGHGGGGGGGFHGGGMRGGFGGGAHYAGRGFGGRGYYGRGYYGRGGYGGYGWRGGGWGGGWGWWGPGWWGLGLFLPVLPWYYTSFWWDGIPYYYGDDAYYVWDGDADQYEQVSPPQGFNGVPAGAAADAAPMTNELFAYPKGGQSEAQQARDRTECRQWAARQTATNPSPPPASGAVSGAPPPAAAPPPPAGLPSSVAAHEGYLRAEAACLEARNYTVR